MATDFSYPLDFEVYDLDEITELIGFLDNVEAYDKAPSSVKEATLKAQYDRFCAIINNKAEEKRIDREFNALTGVSLYRVMKTIKK